MLHNKSTGKPDVMAMESLVKWLETQPPMASYDYFDHTNCLVSQYLMANGYQQVFCYAMGLFNHSENMQRDTHYPMEFDEVAVHQPRTFGGALQRAKDFL